MTDLPTPPGTDPATDAVRELLAAAMHSRAAYGYAMQVCSSNTCEQECASVH